MIRQNENDPKKDEMIRQNRSDPEKAKNDLVKCMEWADGSAAHRKGNTT